MLVLMRVQFPMKINLTPVIDIVFLLIIFLIVSYQGIASENLALPLPDECNFASSDSSRTASVTVDVFIAAEGGRVIFSVDSEELADSVETPGAISSRLAEVIDSHLLGSTNPSSGTVLLRIDKNISYRFAQQALSAISQSRASNLEIAVEPLPR